MSHSLKKPPDAAPEPQSDSETAVRAEATPRPEGDPAPAAPSDSGAGNQATCRQPTARQERILELVRRRGFVSIDALARTFEVTPQTIRRDINQLCELELLRRYHGGAGLPSSVENLAYQTRQVLWQGEKQAIARALAEQVPDEASLFINIGTTTEEVAKALMGHRGLRVITNNLNVASIMSSKADFEVTVAGGLVRTRDRGIVGEAAIDLIGEFKLDFGIIGISGIDADGTLLDFDYREVRVARAIMENSRQVFLVADHTKFGRNAMVRLGSLTQLSAVFTDRSPPAPIRDLLKQSEVQLHIAPAPVDSQSAADGTPRDPDVAPAGTP
ncbi:DeoR/GlpR family transcriptional regulator [Rhodovibrio salinarum]|uniref:DeoR/GlpR family transcriptional regulator n=1 Tax=Rhodovibrio salinarum TaxID=1087 RepID=A0A934QMA7_9PROT|nr:DeoR/GlpR family transcriptional regulator [Rhodovibrio salinarum]MBK1699182.1 DeoR/GlpR family transcriptional regulator [Rhodovibrio salinarum]